MQIGYVFLIVLQEVSSEREDESDENMLED